jgi:aldehyde:ferredoxin oxidoreductase
MAAIKGGYWGKILWVDLSTGTSNIETFDDAYARKYLGGVGMATEIVNRKVTKNTNALSPANVLVFATGPFQATNLPSSGRSVVCAKSPLSGYWGESTGGGWLGPQIKKCGFDAIAITGRARKPVYLYLSDNKVEIRDASKYWGLDTVEVVDTVRDDVGDKSIGVTAIGIGGENLVRYACIVNEKHGFYGRTGMGAVMGSKNLKMILAKGTQSPPIARPDEWKVYLAETRKAMLANPFTKGNQEHGQAAAMAPREENGLLPMKNWRQDVWKEVKTISAPYFTEELKIKPWACPYCVMGCHRRITNEAYGPTETGGPEYETLALIGSNLLIDDLKAQVRANEILNRLGVDTIDTGNILAWAFECYEKGLLTKKDTDGIELIWGSGEALVAMCEKIGKREGIGNLLAEGIRACVDAVPGSKEFAQESMGVGFGGHDPRAFYGQVITSIASTRGACHLHGFGEANELGVPVPELGIPSGTDRFDINNKGYISAIFQDIFQIMNSNVECIMYYFDELGLPAQAKVISLITGWDLTPQELGKMGERIVAQQQLFNIKMGMVPEIENVMPKRFEKSHKEGGAAGKIPDWKRILHEYWQTKGFDTHGIPTKTKIKELGLTDYAKVTGVTLSGE